MAASALRRFARTAAALQLTTSLVVGGTAFGAIAERRSSPSTLVFVDAEWRNGHTRPARYWINDGLRVTRKGELPADYVFPSRDALSSDGSQLLYLSGGALRVLGTHTGRDAVVALFRGELHVENATWVGKTIYYTAKRRSKDCNDTSPVELWRKRDGHAPERIAYEDPYRTAARLERPRYGAGIFAQISLLGASPNHRWLLFGRQRLYKIAIDPETTHSKVKALRLPDGWQFNGGAISPDGRTVATSLYDGHSRSQLWLIDTNGAQPRALATTDASLNSALTGPVWSSDGDQIVASTERFIAPGVPAHAIYVIRATGRPRVRRLRTGHNNSFPEAFTRDGRLVTTSFRYSRSVVELFDLRTNRSERLHTGNVTVQVAQR